LDGEGMAFGTVPGVANRFHEVSLGVGLMAKAAPLPLQTASWLVDAAQQLAIQVQVSLMVETKGRRVGESVSPPPPERWVVRVEGRDVGEKGVPAVHRPQILVAAPTRSVRDVQQALLSLVVLMAVRAIAHIRRNLALAMRRDDLWPYDHPRSQVHKRSRHGLVEKPAVTLGARSVHDGFRLALSPGHFVQTPPRFDVALLAIEAFMGRSESTGKEKSFHVQRPTEDEIANG
jgi:hypothetical protein